MARSLEDDFWIRARNQLRKEFVEAVIPSHFLPFLTCLSTIDEERVQAKERNEGPTLAASLLFDLILHRPNWPEDLRRALRHPSEGIPHLAEALEKLLLDVPIRWDINGFVDNHGTACFDGNCSSTSVKMSMEEKRKEHDDLDSEPRSKMVCYTHMQKSNEKATLKETDSNIDTGTGQSAENKAKIDSERENLRLKIIDKIWSFVKDPKDISAALDYVDRVNLQLIGIEKGSLLLKVRVNSIDDLDRLQQLILYGGMKKILDKELIQKHMGIFKDVAKTEGLELLHIKSKLIVHEADLERSKSELLSRRAEQPILVYTEDLLISNFKNENDILMHKRLKENFPPAYIKLMEDPFLQSRLSKFFKMKEVTDALKRNITTLMINDTPAMSIQLQDAPAIPESQARLEDERPLHELFHHWIGEEIVAFIKSIDYVDLKSVVQVAAKLIKNDIAGIVGPFSIKGDIHESFKLFPYVDLTATPTLDEYEKMFIRLESLGFVCKKEGNYEFYSHYLRDMVLAHLLTNYDVMEQIGDKVYTFEFLPLTIVQVHEDELNTESITRTFSKMNLDLSTAIMQSYLYSFIAEADIPVGWLWFYESPLDREGFLSHGLSNIHQITTKNKTGITIKITTSGEILELFYLISDKNVKLLLDSCGIPQNIPEIDISIALDRGHILTSENFERLSQFLGLSKFATKLDMSLCGKIPDDFKRHLETGNFANIKHLNLSGTWIHQNPTEPFGLRYMPRLQTIDVQDCYLCDIGIVSLGHDFALLKELRELNIANNSITSKGLQDLSNLMNQNHRITALRIQNNNVGPEGGVVLAGWLKKLYLLDTLDISLCRVGDVGIRYISGAIVSKVLRQISVRENEVTKIGSAFFFQNMKCKQMIEHLDYGGNRIFHELDETYADVETPEGHSSDTELEAFLFGNLHWSYLKLWNCNLSKRRIFQCCEQFQGMKDLVHLCLQGNQIDDKFAEDVGACIKQHCEQIRHINLRHNKIGNSGALAIADGVADKKYLEELLVDRNYIEEVGIRELIKVTLQIDHAVKLDVSCNSIAVSAIDLFAAELFLQVSEPSKDVTDEQKPNTYYVPVNKPETQIYM